MCRSYLIEETPAPAAEELARAWIAVVGETLERQKSTRGRRIQDPSDQSDNAGERRSELSNDDAVDMGYCDYLGTRTNSSHKAITVTMR